MRSHRRNSDSCCGCNFEFVVVICTFIVLIISTTFVKNVDTSPFSAKYSQTSNTSAPEFPGTAADPYALPLTRESDLGGRKSLTNNRKDYNPKSEWDWDWEDLDSSGGIFRLNGFCKATQSMEKIICSGLKHLADLPAKKNYLNLELLRKGIFVGIQNESDIQLQDLKRIFPNLEELAIVQSPLIVLKFLREIAVGVRGNKNNTRDHFDYSKIGIGTLNANWPSVRLLNLSRNELKSEAIPSTLMTYFPNLVKLVLAGNAISTLSSISPVQWSRLTTIDLSENPLDCTSAEMEWVESPNITLLNVDQTLCDHPPHQNRPKPIFQTIHLIKKVKAECRLNCTCHIDYIWEKDKVVYSKTAVNCSNRNFIDFPDPYLLPQPTDILYLNNNKITSIKRFVNDHKFMDLNIKNLYLDNNQISSIESLESSDWIYTFQILSLRKNNLSEVPIHLLENVLRQNNWIYLIDLSENNWTCECRTVSTFKVWLLQHAQFIKNIDNVRCGKTGREIRYLKNEDWCKRDEVSQILELLDCLSIFLALLIILVITKVIYDYWKLKKYGKIPWIVSKM